MNYIMARRVPQFLGLLRRADIDLYFSILKFIFNMQKNTVFVPAAHFPFIKDDSSNFYLSFHIA